MKVLIRVAILVLFLNPVAHASDATKAVQEYASLQMRDPDSVKFRNVQARTEDREIYGCGWINATNQFGGYVGYRPFAASPTLEIFKVLDSEMSESTEVVAAFQKLWNVMCPGVPIKLSAQSESDKRALIAKLTRPDRAARAAATESSTVV